MPADAPQKFDGAFGVGKTFGFSLYDGAAAVFKTGAALGAGNTLISKDFGAFGNTTNNAAELAATGVYTLALTAAEMTATDILIKVTKAGTIADKLLQISTAFDAGIRESILNFGLAQGPGTGPDKIQLNTAASGTDGYYVGGTVILAQGTGAGQFGTIISYTAATQDLQVSDDWALAPDNTTVYYITAGVNVTISASNVWTTQEGAQPTGAIPDNATFGQILQYIKRLTFNDVTQTVTTRTVFKDDSTTPLTTMDVSYDGVTQSKGKGV